jgi:hypothetical protein
MNVVLDRAGDFSATHLPVWENSMWETGLVNKHALNSLRCLLERKHIRTCTHHDRGTLETLSRPAQHTHLRLRLRRTCPPYVQVL